MLTLPGLEPEYFGLYRKAWFILCYVDHSGGIIDGGETKTAYVRAMVANHVVHVRQGKKNYGHAHRRLKVRYSKRLSTACLHMRRNAD